MGSVAFTYVGKLNGTIYSKFFVPVASNFTRIINLDSGSYVEFTTDQLLTSDLEMVSKDVNAEVIQYRSRKAKHLIYSFQAVSKGEFIQGRWYVDPRNLFQFEPVLDK